MRTKVMKRIHIVGRKNSGKTTLIVDLVQYLASQGYRVGTIKHTHHDHELDTPGKDSHRHRNAGAAVVGILTRGMTAVFQPSDQSAARDDSRYASMAPMFADCDLVLVEGDLAADAPRIEVWRAATLQPPISVEDPTISALISDEKPKASIPVWKRCDLATISKQILQFAEIDAMH